MLVHVQWRNDLLKCTKHLVTKLQLECSYQEYWDFIGQYQVSNSHSNFRASIYDRWFPFSYVHLLCSWYRRLGKFCCWNNFAVETNRENLTLPEVNVLRWNFPMYSSGYNNSNQVIFENGSWHSRLSASFVVFIAVKSVRWSFIPKIVPVGAVVFLIHLYVLWVLFIRATSSHW